jgi:flagellar basal-body rod modification protein FlgD
MSPVAGVRSTPDPAGTSNTTTNSAKKPADTTEGLANESTFLKLLVAQIKNQNPLNPTDGVQFLTQLAQFSSLEQNLQIKDTLGSILSTLTDRLPAAADAAKTDTGTKTN